MPTRLSQIPFIVVAVALVGLSMLLPATYAARLRDWEVARAFLNAAILLSILCTLVGIAASNQKGSTQGRSDILVLLATFLFLPLIMAFPFYEALKTTRFINAYTEMVSSFTTTGATLFDPDRLHPSLHLWRAMCGWFGGILMWASATAVFAPLSLGGYEISQRVNSRRDVFGNLTTTPLTQRVGDALVKLLPIYVGLTALLWILMVVSGTRSLEAAILAMSTLSTSGITLDGDVGAGRISEAVVLLFLVFAFSRAGFDRPVLSGQKGAPRRDPELRMALTLILIVSGVLVLRQFFGAIEVGVARDLNEAARALWGAIFTAASFLSTSGFISADWAGAQGWSGLPTPGLVLISLALVGGGVATTAGGIKLLRFYALIKHGQRELDRLIYPNSVGGSGKTSRRVRREGAYIAWVFFMLFAIVAALVMMGFAGAGADFDEAAIFTVAALSNTGPLAQIAADTPLSYMNLTDPAKILLIFAMVLGRLEVLALIALLNPEFWRA